MKPLLLICQRRGWAAIVLLTLVCAGCSTSVVKAPVRLYKDLTAGRGEQFLDAGVTSYDNGDYKTAEKNLQSALDLGLDSRKQAKAHKYLAFIDCTSGHPQSCRDQFRKALETDPGFELEPAEAGHPTWGPVYRGVKAEIATRARSR
jgi:Tfp pilus assembly protein PilF